MSYILVTSLEALCSCVFVFLIKTKLPKVIRIQHISLGKTGQGYIYNPVCLSE